MFTLLGVTGVHVIRQHEEGDAVAHSPSQHPTSLKTPSSRPESAIPPFDGIAPPSKEVMSTLSQNVSTFANKFQKKLSHDFDRLTTNFLPRYIQSCQNTADLGVRVVVRAINKVADLFGRD